MSNNHLIAGAFCAALLTVVPADSAVFRIRSVTASRIVVEFSQAARAGASTESDAGFTFGYVSGPGVKTTVSAHGDDPGVRLTVEKKAAGFAGPRYIEWVVVTPAAAPLPSPVTGTLAVEFPASFPVPVSPFAVTMRHNVVTFVPAGAAGKKTAAALPEQPVRYGVRIELSADGIYQIDASELASRGVAIDRIASGSYRLFEGTREVPIYITNSQRTFLQPDDRIFFYGTMLRGTGTHFTQYSNTNVYWLTWNTGRPGMRVTEASGAIRVDERVYRPGEEQNSLAARDFADTVHLEQDNDIRWLGDIFVPQEPEQAAGRDEDIDNWYWGFIGTEEKTEFKIILPSPSQSGMARLRIGLTGLSSIPEIPVDHQLGILINNKSPSPKQDVRQTAAWDGQTDHVFVSDYFPASLLSHGDNTLTFLREPGTRDRSALNWVEVEYTRTFTALSEICRFKNNTEDVDAVFQFTVKGFTGGDLELWDLQYQRRFKNFSVVRGQGDDYERYNLTFQDTCVGAHTYYAGAVSRRLCPESMTLDTVIADWQFDEPPDYLIITREDFFKTFEPLVELYRDRGLACALIDIHDVYNRFSHGRPDPESIRAFLAHMLDRFGDRAPRYLLLGGDTSHDLDKQHRELNVIPTHLSRVPNWGPCSNDGYFATAAGDDNYPDMYVGRFPIRNSADAEILVDKTVRYVRYRDKGPWRDNLVLLGGQEVEFSRFNDEIVSSVLLPNMNVRRMDAWSGSPYYKDRFVSSRALIDLVNAGAYAINFNGHGGGNVWSDNRFFTYDNLPSLYNGQWERSGRLPIVFSFTCLTGFFESVFYRSLGEEFIRDSRNGAIAFYGASAYTSKTGNLLMNRIVLEKAANERFESIGELLWYAEMEMLVRYGGEFLSLVRQYNLLGDPALPWSLAPESCAVSLNGNAFEGRDTVQVSGTCTPAVSGKAKVYIGADARVWNERIVPVTDGAFSAGFPLKKEYKTTRGWVRAYAWKDTTDLRGIAYFSKDSFLVHDVRIEPAFPSAGDDVTLSCRIALPAGTTVSNVLCVYGLTLSAGSLENGASMLMSRDTGDVWTTSAPLSLDPAGNPFDVLKVMFRLQGPQQSRESDLFVFPVKGNPDLLFTGDSLLVYWANDSLTAEFQVLNGGTVAADPFIVTLFWGTEASNDTAAVVRYDGRLGPARNQRFTVALPDTQGDIAVSCRINASRSFDEVTFSNNRSGCVFSARYADLRDTGDTLFSSGRGLALSPLHRLTKRKRVFLFTDPISEAKPLRTESSWIPLETDSVFRFSAAIRGAAGDSLSWSFRPADTAHVSSALSAVVTLDPATDSWMRLTAPARARDRVCAHTVLAGPHGLARLADVNGPDIRASVHGRELKFLDFAAQNKPFSIFITDPSGIMPASIEILLNGRPLDSAFVSRIPPEDDLTGVTLTAYPGKQRTTDSLTIRATDFAGNSSEKIFAYHPGEELDIRFLSCHPNPFSAKQINRGQGWETARIIRFAFVITDIATNAVLSIHTMTGKNIMQWRLGDIIGYQEIEWDGKTREGFRIANGTYYAKLVVKNDRKKVTKIIRIAKLEGY